MFLVVLADGSPKALLFSLGVFGSPRYSAESPLSDADPPL